MVYVYDDKDSLSLGAARLFAEEARRAVESSGRFDVFLSGGDTPRSTYQLLGKDPLRQSIPWEGLQIFWGDERYVPHDDPRSNFRMARQALLDHVPLGESQVHPIPYEATPSLAAKRYEELLRRNFDAASRIDLVLLGLGEDGHTASLFPGSAAIRESERWAAEVFLPEQEMYRVTVTPALLNRAAVVAFLVSGSAKADILHRVLEGDRDTQPFPAQLIRPVEGKLLWLVDREAASLLSKDHIDCGTS